MKGNLSNVVQPRVLLVFEGALGHISGEDVKEFNLLASEGAWGEAWDLWTINEGMAGMIWQVAQKQFIQTSVVTFVNDSERAGLGLQETLDSHGLPISEVIATTPKRLARELAYMPDVACVYDANPESWAMFGRKGRALQNVNDYCRFL